MFVSGHRSVLGDDVVDIGRCGPFHVVLRRSGLALYDSEQHRFTVSLDRSSSSVEDDGPNVALHVNSGTCVVVTHSGALLCYTLEPATADGQIRYAQTVRLKTRPDLLAVTTSDIWFATRGGTELRRLPWTTSAGSATSHHVTLARPVVALHAYGNQLIYHDDEARILDGDNLGPVDALCYDPLTLASGQTIRASGRTISAPFAVTSIERASGPERTLVLCHAGGFAILSSTGTLLCSGVSDSPKRASLSGDTLLLLEGGRLFEIALWTGEPFSRLLQRRQSLALRPGQGGPHSSQNWHHIEKPGRERYSVAAVDGDTLALVVDTPYVLSLQTNRWTPLEVDESAPGRYTHLKWLGSFLVAVLACDVGETRLLLYEGSQLLDIVALPCNLLLLGASDDVLHVTLESGLLYLLRVEGQVLIKTGEVVLRHDLGPLRQVGRRDDSTLCLVGDRLFQDDLEIATAVDAFEVCGGDLWTSGAGKVAYYPPGQTERLYSLDVPGLPVAIAGGLIRSVTSAERPPYRLQVQTHLDISERIKALLRDGQDATHLVMSMRNDQLRNHTLEVLLYEAVSQGDGMTKSVWRLVQVRDDGIAVLTSFLRKTDVSVWRRLFASIGSADSLFRLALARNDLRSACNLVLAVVALESCEPEQVIAELMRSLLAASEFRLARDLLRFAEASKVPDGQLLSMINPQPAAPRLP